MKTIKLLGELGKKFGRVHTIDVNTTAEAIRALCANFKDFESWMSGSEERGVRYKVFVRKSLIGVDQIHYPASREITIAPVLVGSKGGLLGAVLGVALIAASFFLPVAPLFMVTTGALAGVSISSIAFAIGVSMALGGVAQMLAPIPTNPSGNESDAANKPSYSFNGAVNTTAQGYPVPVGYGRLVVGSAVISGGLKAQAIS